MFKHILYIFSAAALLLSCEKNSLQLPIDPVTSGARIKLVHAAPDISSIDLFVNGVKFSGFIPVGATATFPGRPTGIPYNSTFPNTGSNYAVLKAGAQPIAISIPASTSTGSATVINTQTLNLEDNKYYSLFVAGPGAQPEVLLINDNLEGQVDPSKLYVRFVNMIPGSVYDVALTVPNTTLATNLAYKGVTPFIPVDAIAAPIFGFRLPGVVATNIGVSQFTNSSSGRAITVFLRGVVGRAAPFAPSSNIYVNR